MSFTISFKGFKYIVQNASGNLLDDDLGDDVNLGCIFANQLTSFRSWAKKTMWPNLYIGGVLTPLFVKAKVPLHLYYKDTNHEFLDYPYPISHQVWDT